MNLSISLLTWNRLENTRILIDSLKGEIEDLSRDNNVFFNICDNGSDDGTVDYIKNCDIVDDAHFMEENMGISIAKNVLIDKAISQNSKFMFMFDNDVKAIKGSLREMVKTISSLDGVGCLGQKIDFYTKDLNSELIPKKFPVLESKCLSYNVKSGYGATRAWTHYSVYDVDLFREGIRFDVSGPFGSAGYGFDDDDLGMQIRSSGYDIVCFENIYCYHNINSSVGQLRDQKNMNYEDREKFFKNKWRWKLNEE